MLYGLDRNLEIQKAAPNKNRRAFLCETFAQSISIVYCSHRVDASQVAAWDIESTRLRTGCKNQPPIRYFDSVFEGHQVLFTINGCRLSTEMRDDVLVR